jgi:hypothetical protein
MSEYKAYGIKAFSRKVIFDLTIRIQEFEQFIMNKQKEDPEALQVRSKQEWLKEYRRWSERE